MIQIDMDMPENCFECNFRVFSRYGLSACSLKPGLTFSRDFIASFPRKRHADCPVIDVNALKHFEGETNAEDRRNKDRGA